MEVTVDQVTLCFITEKLGFAQRETEGVASVCDTYIRSVGRCKRSCGGRKGLFLGRRDTSGEWAWIPERPRSMIKTQGGCTTENSIVVNTTNLKNIQKANQQWGRGQQWRRELVYYAKAI